MHNWIREWFGWSKVNSIRLLGSEKLLGCISSIHLHYSSHYINKQSHH